MSIQWDDQAILLSRHPHGENGAVVGLLTKIHGRYSGYIHGGQGKSGRANLQQGNILEIQWSARLPEQLGNVKIINVKALSSQWMDDPVRLAAITSACILTETSLPERFPQEDVFSGLHVMLAGIGQENWPIIYFYWEKGLLNALGYGLDLASCAVTGSRENLVYVSPRSGRAVSAEAGEAYHDKLLKLPNFLVNGVVKEIPGQEAMAEAFLLMGYFFEKHVFHPSNRTQPAARLRLAELLGIMR